MNQEPSGRCKIHPLVGKSDSQQAGHLARHASAESDFIFHLFFSMFGVGFYAAYTP